MAFDWIQVDTDDCSVQRLMRIITKSPDFHLLDEKWTSFAFELELGDLEVKELKRSRRFGTNQLSDVVREVISIWVGKAASQATLDKLLSSLESSGLKFAADSLRGEFQPVNSDLDVLTYYVNRTIITRNRLNKEKLITEIKCSEDHFIFNGIALSTLNYIMEKESIEHSTKLLGGNAISQKCIVLDHRTHYDKLCEIAKRPVHLIHCEEDKWIHFKSSGNLSFIQRLTDRNQTHREEDTFVKDIQWKLSNHPICIADSPGMGKTTLLHSIAKKLLQMYSKRAVWFVTVNKFVNVFKQNGGGMWGGRDVAKIQSAFESTCIQLFCPKSTQKSSLAPKLNSQKLEIELLLDGLDEVVSSNAELAFEVLKFLLKYPSIRIWVATRPHLQTQLENCLNVFGSNLQPFNETDQIKFLTQYWNSKCENLDYPRLEKFTKNCLSELKSKLSKKDEDIAGIPLQCLLIAKVYKEQAIEHSSESPNESGIIRIGSLIELYDKLIDKQTKKYRKHYGERRLSSAEIDKQHIILSIQLIFPEIVEILPPPFDVEVCLDELLKVGLLEKSSTILEPKFIHRTIGEYFISLFISQILETDTEDNFQQVLKQLLSNVLFHCKEIQLDLTSSIMSYSVKSFYFLNTEICYFLNLLIGESPLHYDFATSKENMEMAVHACVYGNYYNVFKIFDNPFNRYKHVLGDIIFNEEFLFLTVRYSSDRFVQCIFGEGFDELEEKTKIHSLFLAVKSGNASTCQYLINKQNLREMLERQQQSFPQAKLVLHECVKNTENDSGTLVQQKIEILKLISEINADLLEQEDLAHRTPVLCESIHLDLLTELVSSRKVNIMAKDIGQNTIFHRHYIHPEILFEFIPEDSLKILIKQKNSNKLTPLMTLIQNLDPTEKTLSKFKQHRANFNCKTPEGHSLLAVGIVKGRHSETIRNLIKFGANLRWKKGLKRKSLAHYAGQYGNVDVMLCLADQFKISFCSKDWSGKCAVDYLVESFKERGHTLNYDQFISIIERAPKVQIEFDDKTKETVLINSVAAMNVAAVEYLLSNGIEFLGSDFNNNQEWDGKCDVVVNLVKNFKTEPGSKIIKILINKEVISARKDVLLVRMDIQTTLLHVAVQHGSVESVNFLIDYGTDLNFPDEDGIMPLELIDWSTLGLSKLQKRLDYIKSIIHQNKNALIPIIKQIMSCNTDIFLNSFIECIHAVLIQS